MCPTIERNSYIILSNVIVVITRYISYVAKTLQSKEYCMPHILPTVASSHPQMPILNPRSMPGNSTFHTEDNSNHGLNYVLPIQHTAAILSNIQADGKVAAYHRGLQNNPSIILLRRFRS